MLSIPSYIVQVIYLQQVIGSGFLVDTRGTIATSYHVIRPVLENHESKVSVRFISSNIIHDAYIDDSSVSKQHDVALLRCEILDYRQLSPAKLIVSDYARSGLQFQVIGTGQLKDPGYSYEYTSAVGTVVGPARRNNVDLLQLESKQILKGMSGAPVFLPELNGVVGIISGRYSINPIDQTWMRDTIWASRIDVVGELDNSIKLIRPFVRTKNDDNANPSKILTKIRVLLFTTKDIADIRAIAKKVLRDLPYTSSGNQKLLLDVKDKVLSTSDLVREIGTEHQRNLTNVLIFIVGSQFDDNYFDEQTKILTSLSEFFHTYKTLEGRLLLYRSIKEPIINLSHPERDMRIKHWDWVNSFFDHLVSIPYIEFESPEEFRLKFENDINYLTDELTSDLRTKGSQESDNRLPVKFYPGLRPFTENDADVFFGRGHEIDKLFERVISKRGITVITGPSGSGKSSLVSAGLIPRLLDFKKETQSEWLITKFSPAENSNNPIRNLVLSLQSFLPSSYDINEISNSLEKDAYAIADLCGVATRDFPLLIFIDQFEELWSNVTDKHRDSFINILNSIADAKHITILVTIRSDYYEKASQNPVLARLFQENTFPLSTPDSEALYEIITQPAKLAGIVFEKGLDWQILQDTGNAPGALALLAFVLEALYEESKDRGYISSKSYLDLGKVQGALAKRVDHILSRLPEKQTENLARLFKELVEINEWDFPVRRRLKLEKVLDEDLIKLIDELTSSRLLVKSSYLGVSYVELGHDALMTSWSRLKSWIEEFRDKLKIIRQVRSASKEWIDNGKAVSFLWPNNRLMLIHETLGVAINLLTEEETEFIELEFERYLRELNDPKTDFGRKIIIGNRLAEIGDVRDGIGVKDNIPDIKWCEIPEMYNKETKTLDRFFISKFPITYIQFQFFIDEMLGMDEYARSDSLFAWHQFNKVDNHPADNVSYWDAVKFCKWMTRKTGMRIRLPTDREWLRAAVGDNVNWDYPWGSDWVTGDANTLEEGVLTTVSVGLCSKNKSLFGVMDMIGNVWEWCDKTPHETSPVVYGGSWFNKYCSVKYGYEINNPNFRGNVSGFRVVCESLEGQG